MFSSSFAKRLRRVLGKAAWNCVNALLLVSVLSLNLAGAASAQAPEARDPQVAAQPLPSSVQN
jgi:hypothetical protein